MYSGAPITKKLLQKSIQNFGNVLIQFYGMTEAGAIMFVLPKADHVLEGPHSDRIRSAGIPVFSNQARVVDENGNDVRPGEVGEIIVKTPAVMQGYWKRPELTSETLRDGWLHTGDLGTVDKDNYVYIVGRKKDMIISGGENIYARGVEDVIASYRGIKEVAVIGVPHDKWGETVAALVVLEEGAKVTKDDIIDHSKSQLASYKKPTAVIFIDELPRNALGKVQKTMLKELYSSHSQK
jgi:acyl-CoA synthetase (AMP-forming)/AMP-acid ligase II